MAKNLQISFLLDFYGEMLTGKQREAVELYYNEDLSLAEIAQHSGITRQGVRDCIKRAENQLLDYEEKLGLLARFQDIQQGLGDIIRCATELQEENKRVAYSAAISSKADHIIQVASQLNV